MILNFILSQAAAAADSLTINAQTLQETISSLSGLTLAEVAEYLTNAALTLGLKIIQIVLIWLVGRWLTKRFISMVKAMMAKKKTMSQLCEGLTIYPQVLKNVRVADKTAAQNDPDVRQAVADVGAKLGDSGRILVRESGTEPLVRVMVEAETQEACQEYVDFVVDTIVKKGYAV